MKSILLALLLFLPMNIYAQGSGISQELPKMKVQVPESDDILNIKAGGTKDQLLEIEDAGFDIEKAWQIIPPESRSVIKFDFQQKKLIEFMPETRIQGIAKEAVKSVPKWLQPALYDNLRKLTTAHQYAYAEQIMDAPELWRDEIAFCIAHLAVNTLQSLAPEILNINAEYIYKVDSDLRYVDLVENGSVESGDWHTTTKYRVIKEGDTVWIEIPYEIYYWWIVMPKLSDEHPSMGGSVNNDFWRRYIYENADEGYPVLRDVMMDCEVMWDLQPHKWKNEDADENKIPFADSIMAVGTVGRWVAHNLEKKNDDDVRPVQPNQILHHHNGNCGELQDLLNAGCRTALLPVSSVGSYPGDHVWNELWWDGEWWYYQVSWDCGPTILNQTQTYKDKGLIHVTRPDMMRYMVNEHYNPVCTLDILTRDQRGNPVDGAEVTFFSGSYREPHGDQLYFGTSIYTDADGRAKVLLGADINYGLRVDSKIGSNPAENNRIFGIRHDQALEGASLESNITIPGQMPQLPDISDVPYQPGEKYKLEIGFDVPYRILSGDKYWTANINLDNFIWHDFRSKGTLDFFICDEENFYKYLAGEDFKTLENLEQTASGEFSFLPPADGNFYIVYSNETKLTTSQMLQQGIYLQEFRDGEYVTVDSLNSEGALPVLFENDVTGGLKMNIYPNPVTNAAEICFGTDEATYFYADVYDISGRYIKTLNSGLSCKGNNTIRWDCSGMYGKRVQAGTYLIRIKTSQATAVKKIIVN